VTLRSGGRRGEVQAATTFRRGVEIGCGDGLSDWILASVAAAKLVVDGFGDGDASALGFCAPFFARFGDGFDGGGAVDDATAEYFCAVAENLYSHSFCRLNAAGFPRLNAAGSPRLNAAGSPRHNAAGSPRHNAAG